VGVVVSVTNTSSLRQELSGVSEWPKIVRMTATSRPQRRYDHRLRISSTRTRDVTIAPNLGVPWSTARGWLAAEATVVISLDVAEVTESELRQEILKLRQRVEKRAALLRLALALLTNPRVPALKRSSAGRRSQAADPARRGSGGHVYPVTSSPAVPASGPRRYSPVFQPLSGNVRACETP